ncbi:hypothetical protein CLOSTHATH_03372 [Hungatella hathewayi DSM 13479]|uniref:Uncharacterized protein n=1 Tax=Hungatella hathewayi DSM 13479 TaxID=566550 RepID=D3AID2_9FIRM|nr:hypothetical protein CLOSTHATH_03372 [Hungatella hathewayi DSM 13479]
MFRFILQYWRGKVNGDFKIACGRFQFAAPPASAFRSSTAGLCGHSCDFAGN